MKTKYQFPLILGVLLFLVIFLSGYAIGKEAVGAIDEEKGVSLESIDELFSLVKTEYVGDTAMNIMVNGAITGMRGYLKKQKLDDSLFKEIPGEGPEEEAVKKFDVTYKKLLSTYPRINKEQLSYATIRGMLESLKDPYTTFLDPKEYSGLMEQMKGGSFGGIGIYIELDKEKENQLTIVETIEGTPGYEAGLKGGDVIVKVDGHPTKGMTISQAQKLLRGQVGSRVVLTIGRPGEKEPLEIEIIRDNIQVRSLSYKMLDNNIGYVKLTIFGDNTSAEIREALEVLDEKGAKAYILDLRNNGGGYVNAAISVCSEFLPTGSKIVTIVKKDSSDIPYTSSPNLRAQKPIVSLVNKYSASASEITAGALQDHQVAKIMGVKTFGKASVQKIYPLPNGSAIKITTARYLTPKGRYINKKGITPDILVEEKQGKDDNQLQAAQELLLDEIKMLEGKKLENSIHKDAIFVSSLGEQYDYIRKTYGDNVTIVKDEIIQERGFLFNRITIKDQNGEKVIYFNLQEN